jgi:actin-related protein
MLPVLVHYEPSHNTLQFGLVGQLNYSGEIPCHVGRSRLSRKNCYDCLSGSTSSGSQEFQSIFIDANNTELDPDDPAARLVLGNQNNNIRDAILKYSYPVKSNGRIDNFAEFEKLLQYGLQFELNREELSEDWLENGILMSETSFHPFQRERLSEIIFETIGFHSFGIKNSAVLKLIGESESLTPSGILVDGFNAIPVYEGCAVNFDAFSCLNNPELQNQSFQELNLNQLDEVILPVLKSLNSEVSSLVASGIYCTQKLDQQVVGRNTFVIKEIDPSGDLVWKGASSLIIDDWDIFNHFVSREEYYEIGPQAMNRKTWS